MPGLRFFLCLDCDTVYASPDEPPACADCDGHRLREITSGVQDASYFAPPDR
jgi:hypothetical protein